MIDNKTFDLIMLHCCSKKWLDMKQGLKMSASWQARPDNEKDLFQLEAYLANVCDIDAVEHLLD